MFKTLVVVCLAGIVAFFVMVNVLGYNPVAVAGHHSPAMSELVLGVGSQMVYDYEHGDFTTDVEGLFKAGTFHQRGAIWRTSEGVNLSVVSVLDGESWFVLGSYHDDGSRIFPYTFYKNESVKVTVRDFEWNKDDEMVIAGVEEVVRESNRPILK